MSNTNTPTDNENVKKILILTKAVISERDKSKQLEQQISSLKEKLYEKEEIITQLKNKNKLLTDNEMSKDPKNFFDFLNKNNTELINEEEQKKLKLENESLKSANKTYQDQIQILSTQVAQISEELNTTKETLNLKIENLRKTLNEKQQELDQNQIQIKVLSSLSQKMEVEKVSVESSLKELKKTSEDLDDYKQENKRLNLTINHLMLSIDTLRQTIEKINDEKFEIESQLRKRDQVINKNYKFQGLIYVANVNHFPKFSMTYDFDENLLRVEEDSIEEEITISSIIYMKLKHHTKNVILLQYIKNNQQIDKEIIFNPREIDPILGYYKEISINNNLDKIKFIGDSVCDYY